MGEHVPERDVGMFRLRGAELESCNCNCPSGRGGYTTGRRVFAEGLKPSAKALQPSAKDLPRAALGEEPSGKKTSAKDSLPRAFFRALGIVFAEG